MLSGPPPSIMIVGGLTIDEFSDGRRAPGGSVLHAATAVADCGVVTVSGDEPEARAGLERLGDALLARQPAPSSIRYGHREAHGRRVLTLLARGSSLEPATVAVARAPIVVLAPVAGELPPSTLAAAIREGATNVALLQGWLRHLVVGEAVRPIALSALDGDVVGQLRRCRAVVASTEDLDEEPGDPFRQAALMRTTFGSDPVIVLTLGAEGFLLDDPTQARVVASVPREVVQGVPTVGAGDVFGTALAVQLGRGRGPLAAAEGAADVVVAMLQRRRRSS